jgi:protease-4
MPRRLPALTAVVLALMLTACSVISIDLTPRIRPLTEQTVEGRGPAKILLLDLSGVISDEGLGPVITVGTPPARVPLLVRIREELKKGADDGKVRALVLRINSPGGTVTASDIIYREIMLFKARTGVPVVASLMDVAASGGYYVALAADRIIAHPTTVTGSIGTIMVSLNAEGLMQKVGLSALTIKSDQHKDMGSPFRPITAEERAIFQSVIDELQRQFVAKVVERRRLAPEVARSLADGRIYTAQQALEHHLIDAIGYVSDAVTAARRAAGVDEARLIVYRRPHQYRATYYAKTESAAGPVDSTLGQWAGLAAGGPRFLYLWWP